jgi:hypothetical protein
MSQTAAPAAQAAATTAATDNINTENPSFSDQPGTEENPNFGLPPENFNESQQTNNETNSLNGVQSDTTEGFENETQGIVEESNDTDNESTIETSPNELEQKEEQEGNESQNNDGERHPENPSDIMSSPGGNTGIKKHAPDVQFLLDNKIIKVKDNERLYLTKIIYLINLKKSENNENIDMKELNEIKHKLVMIRNRELLKISKIRGYTIDDLDRLFLDYNYLQVQGGTRRKKKTTMRKRTQCNKRKMRKQIRNKSTMKKRSSKTKTVRKRHGKTKTVRKRIHRILR